MKALNLRYSLIAAAFLSLVFMGKQVKAQTVAPYAAAVSIEDQKNELNNFIGSVRYERNRITTLEEKLKADRKAGNELAAIEDQRQLIRARGNLDMSKAYVKAEKKMIVANHNLAIDEQRGVVRQDCKMLSKSKTDKNKADIAKYEAAVDRDKQALRDRRVAKNEDVMAMNKKIKKQNGQFIGSLYAENAVAATKNWVQK